MLAKFNIFRMKNGLKRQFCLPNTTTSATNKDNESVFTNNKLNVQPMKYFIVCQPCIVNKAISFLTLVLTKKDKGAEYLTSVLTNEIFLITNSNKQSFESQTGKNY